MAAGEGWVRKLLRLPRRPGVGVSVRMCRGDGESDRQGWLKHAGIAASMRQALARISLPRVEQTLPAVPQRGGMPRTRIAEGVRSDVGPGSGTVLGISWPFQDVGQSGTNQLWLAVGSLGLGEQAAAWGVSFRGSRKHLVARETTGETSGRHESCRTASWGSAVRRPCASAKRRVLGHGSFTLVARGDGRAVQPAVSVIRAGWKSRLARGPGVPGGLSTLGHGGGRATALCGTCGVAKREEETRAWTWHLGGASRAEVDGGASRPARESSAQGPCLRGSVSRPRSGLRGWPSGRGRATCRRAALRPRRVARRHRRCLLSRPTTRRTRRWTGCRSAMPSCTATCRGS